MLAARPSLARSSRVPSITDVDAARAAAARRLDAAQPAGAGARSAVDAGAAVAGRRVPRRRRRLAGAGDARASSMRSVTTYRPGTDDATTVALDPRAAGRSARRSAKPSTLNLRGSVQLGLLLRERCAQRRASPAPTR